MVGKEDVSGSARVPTPTQPSGSRKMFWRSASWSASRTSPVNLETEDKEHSDLNGGIDNHNGHNRRFPVPLTPRSQQNCKARSCLPPLQPLSIARRSLEEWPKAGSDDIGEWQQPPTPSGKGGGERLKLDLSSIQHNADKNGGLVRRDKIAFFDKKCSKVAEHIYLGGDAVARDREILKHNGITHVLNCVGFVCPEYFKADFVYRTLWLQDSPSEDITSILYDVFDYFEDVREQGGRVFVHCCQGVSRSTSLVIAYLMWREGQSFDDAFQYVKAARGIADPNMGFACQLLQCQKRVHAVPLSPSSLLRMYRIAPHSPYDPLHLVPKMLNEPSPSSLDSRGAFIIHVPSAIYVWIGKNCEAIMERDGRGAVCQIVRYERVQGPITLFKEGEEPTCFWEAFSNLLPLMDKTGGGLKVRESALKVFPGGRKVNSYDVDFEIFQKAIRGGFVPPLATAENEHETLLPARESSWSMLRRKFAPVSMKEFISAPKISLTRIYSDSMMLVHSSKHVPSPSPSSFLASSSSSPLFLSPDSISSDPSINSTYSESSLDSPSARSCSLPVSSVTSSFSNLSLLSSEPSCKSVSKTPETLFVNVTSQPCLESTLSTSKKTSPSLAQRRGSLTKSLKLPVINDKISVANVPSSVLVHQEDGVSANGSSCSSWGTDSMGRTLPSKHGVENGDVEATQQYKIIAKNMPSPDSAQKENAFIEHCGNLWREDRESSSMNEESGSEGCNVMRPLVCRWPSLEKVATFSVNDLDTKAVFAILSQNADLGKNVHRLLYFWVGRSFNLRECQVQLDSDRVLDVEEIDWKQVGSDVLVQMGLPKDAVVKVVKEDEEPREFLELLNRLY